MKWGDHWKARTSRGCCDTARQRRKTFRNRLIDSQLGAKNLKSGRNWPRHQKLDTQKLYITFPPEPEQMEKCVGAMENHARLHSVMGWRLGLGPVGGL